VDALRTAMGIVFQENLLFRDSVRNNIAYGDPAASNERVREAARQAGALGFIEALPQGFDSFVHESGINLSGGQRQRIAIARALLLRPKVLLFDDPTTAVDPETEREVLSAMRAASVGRTSFIVSNRLTTLRYTDRVVVLNHGQIAEQGTHLELMQGSGLYRKAAELQTVDPESLRLLESLGAAECATGRSRPVRAQTYSPSTTSSNDRSIGASSCGCSATPGRTESSATGCSCSWSYEPSSCPSSPGPLRK
jgi:ATP-binding cassette subfamily B protein